MTEAKEEKVLHQFEAEEKKEDWRKAAFSAGVVLVIIIAGTITGYFLSRRAGSGGKSIGGLSGSAKIGSGPKEAGIEDSELFPDEAQGKIEVNDFSEVDEGSHKLLRSGGKSQTAYLTSTVVDLDQFVGECVQVWAETFASQKAGWLMDVGRVKVLDKCPEGL